MLSCVAVVLDLAIAKIAITTAEASETRMVNRRLKKQNEVLLRQLHDALTSQDANVTGETLSTSNEIPYTLSESDIALLDGQKRSPVKSSSSALSRGSVSTDHRQRLIQFFTYVRNTSY